MNLKDMIVFLKKYCGGEKNFLLNHLFFYLLPR